MNSNSGLIHVVRRPFVFVELTFIPFNEILPYWKYT